MPMTAQFVMLGTWAQTHARRFCGSLFCNGTALQLLSDPLHIFKGFILVISMYFCRLYTV
jgi:hypothetical protein